MPMEFVITPGSAWSADPDFGSSFGADKTTAALTTISSNISVLHRGLFCMVTSSKNERVRPSSGSEQVRNISMHRKSGTMPPHAKPVTTPVYFGFMYCALYTRVCHVSTQLI